MKKLLVLRGMPGSGKSTFARELVATDKSWKRVNRDDIRIMSGYHFDDRSTVAVNAVQEKAIRSLLAEGFDVVVDNTHLEKRVVKLLHKIAEDVGDVEVIEKCFRTPLEECIKRNALREGIARVPDDVMKNFERLLKRADLIDRTTVYPPKPSRVIDQSANRSLPKAVICDLDGTLALLNGRNPYDATTCDHDLPNMGVIECIRCMYNDDRTILFTSGREDRFREPTMRFIEKHCEFIFASSIPRYKLLMRETGDQRKDSIVKLELFEKHIKDKYFIDFVLDDRDQVVALWRELGFSTFQVAYGNF